jgi:Subtilisin inhibitor-like
MTLPEARRYPRDMRGLAGLAVAAAALAVCATGSAGSQQVSSTSLTVSYWSDGPDASKRQQWTLRCAPARGTLPRPAVACRKLAQAGAKLFASFPKNVACTQIYGGPQVAKVVGTVRGTRVWASLSRADGCQVSRWDRLSPWLLPAGGTT